MAATSNSFLARQFEFSCYQHTPRLGKVPANLSDGKSFDCQETADRNAMVVITLSVTRDDCLQISITIPLLGAFVILPVAGPFPWQ